MSAWCGDCANEKKGLWLMEMEFIGMARRK